MATDRATGSLTLEIEVTCDTQEDENNCYVALEEDTEYNLSKTCYAPGDYAYFKVYKNGSFDIKATSGTPTRIDSNVSELVEDESISFTNFVGSAAKPISSVSHASWIGISLGHVNYALGTTKVYVIEDTETGGGGGFGVEGHSHDGFGVLKITYHSKFDRYRVKSNEVGDLMAYAIGTGVCEGTTASVTFTFSDDCDLGAKTVTILARDAITNEPIPVASVWVDGAFRGFTNTEGQLSVGILTVGLHTIQITAANYQDTFGDGLANDEFEVTA